MENANLRPQSRITSYNVCYTKLLRGNILTNEQLAALVSYTISAAEGSSLEVGQELYATNCAVCHGEFGEGGPNPARQGDIIA